MKKTEIKEQFQQQTDNNCSDKVTHLMKPKKDNESFKFAITFVVFLGTLLISSFNYVQSNALEETTFTLFFILNVVGTIVMILFLLYLLLKSFSLEVSDLEMSQKVSGISSKIYLFAFVILISLLSGSFFLYLSVLLDSSSMSIFDDIFLPFMVGFCFTLLPCLIARKIKDFDGKISYKNHEVPLLFIIYAMVLIILILFVSSAFFIGDSNYLKGNIDLEMDNVYNMDNEPIFVLINVNGPNGPLKINLIDLNLNHTETLLEKEFVVQEPYEPSQPEYYGEKMHISSTNYGQYDVFINKSDLSTGYYKLSCQRVGWDLKPTNRTFYLFNQTINSNV